MGDASFGSESLAFWDPVVRGGFYDGSIRGAQFQISWCYLVALEWTHISSTIWLFNIAMENGPFIDGLPINNGDFPWLC